MSKREAEAADFHGECTCKHRGCANKAYYTQNDKVLCGFHSQKALRKPLPKNPRKNENLDRDYRAHMVTVKRSMIRNAGAQRHGMLMCSKMTMFQGQQPVFIKDYMNVFPNYKHAKRYGGWGLPELSPKSMGPVEHPQPDLPPSKTLENFHQFSKIFPGETMDEFRRSQIAAFNDSTPHRHKPQALQKKAGENKNIPRAWIWTRADGTIVELTYIECRQFYCHYYERFALQTDAFHRLKEALSDGMNLRICGYDGYMPDKLLMDHYKDPSRPFGHEVVLYTMLAEPEDSWPWRLMKTEVF